MQQQDLACFRLIVGAGAAFFRFILVAGNYFGYRLLW